MANCPKCKQEWLWDWCIDTLRKPNGETCQERIQFASSDNHDVYSLKCTCGQTLGLMHECNGDIDNQPNEWEDIDWELPEHKYDPESEVVQ